MALQKVGPYEVDPKEPWKNDKLDRRKVADYLTPVIASVTQPFTISLHSPYGTGKTSFILSWQADLRTQGYKTVYFNAWETDFSHDAFLAFMAAIRTQLSEQSATPKKIKATVSKATRKGIWSAFKSGAPKIVKGAVKQVAGDETVEGVLEIVGLGADEIAAASEEWVAAALETQEAQEKSRIQFRKELQASVRSELLGISENSRKKLIVFIDDLDRCRPTYAVAVLEAIKHVFNVEGLLFILAIDERQLIQALATVYGAGLDGDGYLRRFLDWRYLLPRPSVGQLCESLCTRFGINNLPPFAGDQRLLEINLIWPLSTLADTFELSAREIEAIFTLINLCLRVQPKYDALMIRVVSIAAVLRFSCREMLVNAIGSEKGVNDLLNMIADRLPKIYSVHQHKMKLFFDDEFCSYFFSIEMCTEFTSRARSMRENLNRINTMGRVPSPSEMPSYNDKDIEKLERRASHRIALARLRFDEPPIYIALNELDRAGMLIG